jgi:hypothetical protein
VSWVNIACIVTTNHIISLARRKERYDVEVDWSVVNLSFSFRTPSTSSYLLVGVKEREDRRRQKTTNRGNKFSNAGWFLSSSSLTIENENSRRLQPQPVV